MIDFSNARFIKLSEVPVATVEQKVAPLYVEGETSLIAAAGARDQVMFTNKRIIAVNMQGLTGNRLLVPALQQDSGLLH